MKIRNFVWIFALLILSVPVFATAQIEAAANGALSIVNLKTIPQPVVAGQNVTITFQLYNSYTSALTNVNIYLTAQNQILNVSPTSTTIVDTIGEGLYEGSIGNGYFTYTFRIPSTLHAGQYTITVVANYQTTQPNSYGGTSILPAESAMPINLYIYGTPSLKLTANLQSAIVPGQTINLPISVVNVGTDVANNVTITLHNSTQFRVSGAAQYSIGTVNPNGSSQFTATVQPLISIKNGTYPVNATITYTSEDGSFVSKNTSVLLNVLINSPNIVASIESASPTNLYSGGNQTLQIQLHNIGLGTAKNITATFVSGPGLNVGSISQFYIPSLSPNNATTETVYISANRSTGNSSITLPVQLKYYSSNYGSGFTNVQYIPINIQKSAIFNITGSAATLSAGNAYKPVTFTVKNIGSIQAQQITFSLQTTFPITPVNPNVYVASLAAGQSTNVTFYVGVDPSGNPGSYPVTLYEQWRQPNGAISQEFSGSNGYYTTVGNASGGNGYTSYIEYGVIAIVVIVAVVMVRRRMGKGKKG